MFRLILPLALMQFLILISAQSGFAQPQTIAIQGQLIQGDGMPLTGTRAYILRFFDDPTTGNQIGSDISGMVSVSNAGRFTIEAEPPSEILNQGFLYYQLGIESTATLDNILEANDFFPDRVRINSVIFALQAENAFRLGTKTSPTLEVIRNSDSNVVVANPEYNIIDTRDPGSTISGGGTQAKPNSTLDGRYCTVSGGLGNTATDDVTVVGGGENNSASGFGSAILGGITNTARGDWSAVGGGEENLSNEAWSTVAGGNLNSARELGSAIGGGRENEAIGNDSTIGGGNNNTSDGNQATISGGFSNQTSANHATVGGGFTNIASGIEATIAGGDRNEAIGNDSTVGGGLLNIAGGFASTIAGGDGNQAPGDWSFIGSGFDNITTGPHAVIVGGRNNRASEIYASIGGGLNNTASQIYSVISGGQLNNASANYSTIGGGAENVASGIYATVAGGNLNQATGNYSMANGRQAAANHNGTFVWADAGTVGSFSSTGENQFLIRAAGGVGINQNIIDANEALVVGTGTTNGNGAYLSKTGTWTNVSDQNKKTDFTEINVEEVLKQILSIPMNKWRYKGDGARAWHIGPMAQDFMAAFGLGESERHISSIDADGVSMAAIQGLNQKLERELKEKDQAIEQLNQRLELLESLLKEGQKNE